MRQFIEGLAAGSLVADVGCGNGKYFLVRQDIAVLGSDRSSGLAQVAATRLAAGTGAASGPPHSTASGFFTLLSNFTITCVGQAPQVQAAVKIRGRIGCHVLAACSHHAMRNQGHCYAGRLQSISKGLLLVLRM